MLTIIVEADADTENALTTLTYDDQGNLASVTDSANNTTLFTDYDIMGNLLSRTDAKGGVWTYEYDDKGRLTSQTDPLDHTSTFEYDTRDNRVAVVDPKGKRTEYEYDEQSNLVKITDPLGNETLMEYALDKKMISQADPAGNTTSYGYDDERRMETTTDPAGNLVQMTYSGGGVGCSSCSGGTGGQPESIIYPTFERQFTYDSLGRKLSETDVLSDTESRTISYAYDAGGNLAEKIDAKNQKTAYTYDDANRLTQIQYFADADDTTTAKTVTFTYDTTGNLLTWDDGSTSGSFTYDDLNRKLSETVDFGDFEKTIAYTWTKNSRKASYTDPSGVVYNYAYADNLLAGIEIPDTGTITMGDYNWNRPETVLLPGGSKQAQTHDPLMRIKSITDSDPGQTSLMTYTYTHDNLDNITKKSTEHGDYEYGYDTLQRLTSADNPQDVEDESYTYDAVGNRLTAEGSEDAWTYNQNNELESHDDTGYEYDANGNMVKKDVGGVTTLFFYNLEDRLTKVTDADGNTSAEYGYDPFGRRLWKEVDDTRTYFMYTDEGLAGEYTQDGTETKTYGWKPDSTWGTDPMFMKVGDEYYFYHNDHLGTPQKMTAVNGAVVWSAKYLAFGAIVVDSDSTIENNLRFPGQYYDAETGLHYNGHRYYDPDTGRYITPDPIGLAGGINPFVYANSNPVNYTDRYGLFIDGGVLTGPAAYIAATAIAGGIIYYGTPIAADIGQWIGNQLWNENTEENNDTCPVNKDDEPNHPDFKPHKKKKGLQKIPWDKNKKGFPSKNGTYWEPVPDGHKGTHDPHWDEQFPNGSHKPRYPKY